MKTTTLFISCEHAVNIIPKEYKHLFQGHEDVLQTHRAIDFGAKTVANFLSFELGCEHVLATASRLLIDCNRSVNNKQCFSEFTSNLSEVDKQKIIDRYYLPYRQQVEATIQKKIDDGFQVLHISVHSFTPVFHDETRNAGIGLLYDPSRHGEKEVARELQSLLIQQIPAFRIRLNYPYKGKSDGFTTALRKKHNEKQYLGIELEMNQALMHDQTLVDALAPRIADSLKELFQLL